MSDKLTIPANVLLARLASLVLARMPNCWQLCGGLRRSFCGSFTSAAAGRSSPFAISYRTVLGMPCRGRKMCLRFQSSKWPQGT